PFSVSFKLQLLPQTNFHMPPRGRRRIARHRCLQCGTYTAPAANCSVCSRRALNRSRRANTSSPSTHNSHLFQAPVRPPLFTERDTNTAVSTPLPPVLHCESCMRCPTVAFPFDCNDYMSANLVSRKYGARPLATYV
ncbi:hypothetical protein FOZ62_008770, partial [Perkinsus olseni]